VDNIPKPGRLGVMLCLWSATLACGGLAADGVVTPDPGFRAAFTTTRGAAVYAVTLQPDGRIVVAGEFSLVGGVPRRGLARLDANGVLDPTFDPRGGVAGTVYDLAVDPGGGILLAGQFTAVDGVPRSGLARLESDGRLDPTFQPELGGRPGWFAGALLVEPDGHILVAGRFTTVTGQPRDGVARLRADGTVDPAFDPGDGLDGGTAYDLALQPDGRVLVAGAFATVDDVFTPGIARLLSDGRLDTSFIGGVFSGGTWGRVYALALQPGAGILVAGEFDTVDAEPRNRIARLHPDGSVDTSFDPGEAIAGGEEAVFDLLALGSGELVVTGRFTSAGGVEHGNLAGFAADGAAGGTFDPGPGLESDRAVTGSMLALQPDGRILAAGQFQTAAGARRHCLARFLPDGSPDETFSTATTFFEFAGTVRALSPLPDGGWLAGGEFERVGGTAREALARIQASGELDPGFDAALNAGATVHAIVRDPAGRVVIGGSFDQLAGVDQPHLARLQPDGSRDEIFVNTGPDAAVRALALLPSGQLLVGGHFVRLENLRRLGLARLQPDGAVDPDFDVRFEMGLDRPFVASLVLLPDGGILAGGRFAQVNGEARRHLARLRADGSLDPAFAASLVLGGPDAQVHALAVGAGGRVLVGGTFTTVNDWPQAGVVRLRTDGSPDPLFQAGAGLTGDSPVGVHSIARLPDGRIMLGGEFSAYDGREAVNLAFLDARGRLLPHDGAQDPDGPVATLGVVTAGSLLVGGNFCRAGEAHHLGLARYEVAAAAAGFYLDISADALGPVVEWEGGYGLQEAPWPAGPWTGLPGATSPYRPPPEAGARYYRLLGPGAGRSH
jgi:uncharacterized delta-60 repeat protein